MYRFKSTLALLCLAVCVVAMTACSQDRHVFDSTIDRPTTVTIYDPIANKPLWVKEIPVGYSLEIDLANENDTIGMKVDRHPATQVSWRVYQQDVGREAPGDPNREAAMKSRPGDPSYHGNVMVDPPVSPMSNHAADHGEDASLEVGSASANSDLIRSGTLAINHRVSDTEGTEKLPGTPVVIKVTYRPSPEYPSDYEQDLVETTSPSVVSFPVAGHETVNEDGLSPSSQETADTLDSESDPMEPLTIP